VLFRYAQRPGRGCTRNIGLRHRHQTLRAVERRTGHPEPYAGSHDADLRGWAEGLVALGIPEPHGVVLTRRGKALPVGAEGDARHAVPCGRSGARREAGRCAHPTAAPSCRCFPRPPPARRLPRRAPPHLPSRTPADLVAHRGRGKGPFNTCGKYHHRPLWGEFRMTFAELPPEA
jgi:hypothetical protein